MTTKQLILGSASIRRKNILSALLQDFTVLVPDIAETMDPDHPRCMAKENAIRKNQWCRHAYPHACIITADTVIDFDGRCMGKPATMDEARSFLRMFSARRHTVVTAAAFSVPDTPIDLQVMESTVLFKRLSDKEIDAYIDRVNPMDKAGAYDIGEQGDLIIESFEGSLTNIMGLSKELLTHWLSTTGFEIQHT